MKERERFMTFETPLDADILEAFIHKQAHTTKADTRRIKRALRKLASAYSLTP